MRESFLALVVGKKRCGKTYFTVRYMQQYKKRFPGRKIIFVYRYPIENLDIGKMGGGVPFNEHYLGHEKGLFQHLTAKRRNCLIVMDDAKLILPSSDGKEASELIIVSGNYGIDLMLQFHSFTYVPPKILENTDYGFFFRQESSYEKVENKLPEWITKEIVTKTNSLQPRNYLYVNPNEGLYQVNKSIA